MVDCHSMSNPEKLKSAYKNVQFYDAAKGRGYQMNFGAAQAQADILLFLHADTLLDEEALNGLGEVMKDEKIVGGSFSFALDKKNVGARLLIYGAHLRNRILKLPYGDQGIFVRKKTFNNLGGYKHWGILEDVDFAYRMKKSGNCLILPSLAVTSARQWESRGYLITTLRHLYFFMYFYLVKRNANMGDLESIA